MALTLPTYKNSTVISTLNGKPVYVETLVEAALYGGLNLFLRGATGFAKTQIGRDLMSQLPADESMFVLGRNDMDVRDLFKQIHLGRLNQKPTYNLEPLVDPDTGEVEWIYYQWKDGAVVPTKITSDQASRVRSSLEKLAGTTENITELTSRIKTKLVVVDELPNCIAEVRAQLFNIFDGFVEVNGVAYPLGSGYTAGIATGNIGQEYTESANDLGRALKDRMHVTINTDRYKLQPIDLLDVLQNNTDPRVQHTIAHATKSDELIAAYNAVRGMEIPYEKLLIAEYLVFGLGTGTEQSSQSPNQAAGRKNKKKAVTSHDAGSDIALIESISPRAAKSVIRLSQALDHITRTKEGDPNYFDSMMLAFKFVGAYSGILNDTLVTQQFGGNHDVAIDGVIQSVRGQFSEREQDITAAFGMLSEQKKQKQVMDKFKGRWAFMRKLIDSLYQRETQKSGETSQ